MLYLGNVYILGDSTSTYEGFIPKDNYCYYVKEYNDGRTDITDVNQTWWYSLIEETGSHLMLNDSFSASTNCYTGYGYITTEKYKTLIPENKALYSPIPGDECCYSQIFWREQSLIERFRRLADSGYFEENKIDTVFIYGGSNDVAANYVMGDVKYGDFTEADLYKAIPATCYLIEIIKKKLPDARILFILEAGMNDVFVENSPKICAHYGIDYVELDKYETINGHATISGMQSIKNKIKEALSD